MWWWWWRSRIHSSTVATVTTLTLHQLPLSPYYLLMDCLLTCLKISGSEFVFLREIIKNKPETLVVVIMISLHKNVSPNKENAD